MCAFLQTAEVPSPMQGSRTAFSLLCFLHIPRCEDSTSCLRCLCRTSAMLCSSSLFSGQGFRKLKSSGMLLSMHIPKWGCRHRTLEPRGKAGCSTQSKYCSEGQGLWAAWQTKQGLCDDFFWVGCETRPKNFGCTGDSIEECCSSQRSSQRARIAKVQK